MNGSLKWFRLYSDFLNNAKICRLSFIEQRHFIGILALKSSGVLDQECQASIMDGLVARGLGVGKKKISSLKNRLIDVALIDEGWQPLGWDQHDAYQPSLRPSPETWKLIRQNIFERDDFTCQYCGERGFRLECDHVIPVSLGGNSEADNLVTACFSCNRAKGAKLVSEWLEVAS